MSGFTPYDKGKKGKMTRKAILLDKEPKDRSKSRPNPKAKYKKRKRKRRKSS